MHCALTLCTHSSSVECENSSLAPRLSAPWAVTSVPLELIVLLVHYALCSRDGHCYSLLPDKVLEERYHLIFMLHSHQRLTLLSQKCLKGKINQIVTNWDNVTGSEAELTLKCPSLKIHERSWNLIHSFHELGKAWFIFPLSLRSQTAQIREHEVNIALGFHLLYASSSLKHLYKSALINRSHLTIGPQL